ncbi:MAG: triose-phosphate isomerase [Thermoplasmata archaeon]|nr:MAG: triose-phosphate isomerase [Thermoplasmata archaeon]
MHVMVVNTKAYKEGMGSEAIKIAKIMEKVGEETGVRMIIAVQHADLYRVASAVNIDVFAQHIDAIEYGSHTGWILPEAIKEAGAKGSILNHSEHVITANEIKKGIEALRKNGMESIVCAADNEIAKALAVLEPDYIAVEPPELIGGDISVTKAKPSVVRDAVEGVKQVSKAKVLCGAGIKNGEDVRKAIELGSSGILVASGVVKAKDKEKIIREMAEAMVE